MYMKKILIFTNNTSQKNWKKLFYQTFLNQLFQVIVDLNSFTLHYCIDQGS